MRLVSFTVGLLAIFTLACGPVQDQSSDIPPVETGLWRFELTLREGIILPFIAEISQDGQAYAMTIHNAEERLPVASFQRVGDSVFIQLSVFQSEFKAKIDAQGHFAGKWYDRSRGPDYAIAFEAQPQKDGQRFPASAQQGLTLAPKYAVGFSVGTADAYPAVGIFKQQKNDLTGTILTETGDYRYLEGHSFEDGFELSAFDGAHAFLFVGTHRGDTLEGTFYSGSHWEEPFMAIPSEEVALRDPDELTYLKEGYTSLEFSFPDAEGQQISLADERFQDKVVIVQILGSWCPNCMDETRLFAEWHDQYQDRGLEIVGLAFERTGDETKAWTAIERMKQGLGVEYPVLLASTSNSKAGASEALPMLNQVMSYPTSIYLDREGRIRKIHTGFYGPGTGAPYQRFVEQYGRFIEDMLAEE
ncbi:MAG: TlpA disulfide reductase family protein [Bacteroidota bacterium]